MSARPNDLIASRLDEIAALLSAQGANPHRVRAYRRGAETLRQLHVSAGDIIRADGVAGLERLPGIGPSLARAIREIVAHGYSPILARLRGDMDAIRLLATVPGVGRRIAARLHDELGLETLADLESAAQDGRLEQIAGFGPKRLEAIRDTLTRIAPRRFNPSHAAWPPILHTTRGPRHYTALFSNTDRAHRLGKTSDWVVLYCDDDAADHQWTVITSEFGRLRGRRIVRGREAECAALSSDAA